MIDPSRVQVRLVSLYFALIEGPRLGEKRRRFLDVHMFFLRRSGQET